MFYLKIIRVTALLFSLYFLFGFTPKFRACIGGTLTIKVENCKSTKGRIFIALYNNEKNFLKEAFAIQKKAVPIPQDKNVIITFENLSYGKYAFAIFHDENNDNKINFNLVGMPTEGYGFSNNARGFMSSPSFSKSAFSINTPSYDCKVKLSY